MHPVHWSAQPPLRWSPLPASSSSSMRRWTRSCVHDHFWGSSRGCNPSPYLKARATCSTLWQQLAQCLCSTLQDTNLQAPLAGSYLQQQQHAGTACVSHIHHPIQVRVLAAAAPPHVVEIGGLMIKGELKDAQALDKAGDCSSARKQRSEGLVARQTEHCRRPWQAFTIAASIGAWRCYKAPCSQAGLMLEGYLHLVPPRARTEPFLLDAPSSAEAALYLCGP